ncbi:hypothetical protein PPSIR1_23369 [Plesiocystis pacifica SIR-1]|uniref:Uncharacterized protein n=1 Tax=Plesiocystis pacifica SIR-1 TaxID=391625 RepID=A6GC98_9BACT|nr:hypothetical protein PPSIR1_23369 [Plesiocystis pacifica SIR-1]
MSQPAWAVAPSTMAANQGTKVVLYRLRLDAVIAGPDLQAMFPAHAPAFVVDITHFFALPQAPARRAPDSSTGWSERP